MATHQHATRDPSYSRHWMKGLPSVDISIVNGYFKNYLSSTMTWSWTSGCKFNDTKSIC